MVKGSYDLNLEEMLLKIPAGLEREQAAIALDAFLGIEHIPTEGYEKGGIESSIEPGELITGDADEPGPFEGIHSEEAYSGVTSLRSGGRRGNLSFSSFVGDFPPTGNNPLDFLTRKVNALLRSVNSRIVKSFTLVRRRVGKDGGGVILEYQASASISCVLFIGFKTGEISIRVDVAGQVRYAGPFVGLKFDKIRIALEIIFGGIK
jgi:hypothetical protein